MKNYSVSQNSKEDLIQTVCWENMGEEREEKKEEEEE